MQMLPSTGRLPTSSFLLFECPQGKKYAVYVRYSEAASGAAAVNLHIKPAQDEKRLLIGVDTPMASKACLPIPDNGSAIHLGPGDALYGDAPSGSVDFVITGQIE